MSWAIGLGLLRRSSRQIFGQLTWALLKQFQSMVDVVGD